MNVVIPLLLVLLPVSSAWCACREAQVPALPDPDYALESEVLAAQQAVHRYLEGQERFLDCVNDATRHDAAVERMHDVARSFNSLARRYKARMESMDMEIDLAWLDTRF